MRASKQERHSWSQKEVSLVEAAWTIQASRMEGLLTLGEETEGREMILKG